MECIRRLLIALSAIPLSFGADVIVTVEVAVEEGVEPKKESLFDGEDAARAAQRVAESYHVYEPETVLSIAKAFRDELQDSDYKPPKELILKTGGAYSRRADEALKEKRFADSAADCLRALMRPGLDSTAEGVFMDKLGKAETRLERIYQMKVEEEQADVMKYAEQNAEADALAKEWKTLLDEDTLIWNKVDSFTLSTGSPSSDAEVVGVDLDLTTNGEKDKQRCSVRQGQDASHAAFHFCAANGIHSADEVAKLDTMLKQQLAEKKYEVPQDMKVGTAATHIEKGQSHEANFDFGAAGVEYARGLQDPAVSAEQKQELQNRLVSVIGVVNASQQLGGAWQVKDHDRVLAIAGDIPSDFRTDTVQLIIARSKFHKKEIKEAVKSITSLLTNCEKDGQWLAEQPRFIGAIAGAILSLQVGDIDKAKKMYQIVLRDDPDQKHIKLRYKALKTYMRILSDIEDLLAKSKNHDAIKGVERSKRVLEFIMGKDGARNAATRLLQFECKAKSSITQHDEAIEACNTAIEQLENHDNPDPRKIAEAYAIRGEANTKDKSYDDAVADMQMALQKVPNSQDYQEKLEEAKKLQSEWNKSEEQHDRRGRSLGHFTVNRPSEEMLGLPENIEELDQEERCKRLKKSFRAMSLRWHPDKAIGGKKRAQRKSSELSEAKTWLEVKFGCKRNR
eukprot:gnl/MRDRNA2_/MRDRNA2_97497_c0_seq1.p1 gnl/MRDRNA2_/MRDRNA2_97497_c0~~gnl/MRDRNA2_/MRDRNA2_97497_c0_seq1.p1  ORF type:complete len:713 (-),score=175.32 gnl/MRDRNA2_/MRDRNA2_97497_c0_seq1:92-2128(-)